MSDSTDPSEARLRRAVRLAVIAAVALTLAIGFAVSWRTESRPRRADLAAAAAPGVAAPSRAAASPPAAEPVVDAALLATPEAQAYFARERFNVRARRFFAEAVSLDAAAREREARELDAMIEAYAQRRELSAGEAMSLRIGLVEAAGGSPVQRADRMAAIVARYESDGQQREARWLAQQAADPSFQRYKVRESVVVAEVLAMARIPGGLSRDEYLRRRLEAERVAAMQ